MRLITKCFFTFALLSMAGVTNAAVSYEVDQKFTSVEALDGQAFAIVNETESKAIFGSGAQNLGYDAITTAVTGSGNTGYYFKLEASTVEGCYLLRLQTPAGEPYSVWGNPGYLNSGAEGGFDGCFILGLNNQNGQDVENGAVWEIEYADGQGFALKNKARDGYFAGANPAPTGAEPIYWTFCTLKEGTEIPDPEPVVIPEPEAPLAEGELIPDFFSICDEGGIPYGYEVKFGSEDRAYPTIYTGGSRMFNFAEGGDFTKGVYFREGYMQYGNVKKLALEAGKKYIVHFNSAMWKSSGSTMVFTITKEGDEEAVLTETINNTPDVNGSKDAVIGSTKSEIEFTPEADGNYILKWNAEGWKEVLLANVGVAAEPVITPAYGTIWENGETAVDGDYTTITLSTAYFNDFAQAGDTVRVTVANVGQARTATPLIIKKGEIFFGALAEAKELQSEATTVDFVLTEDMLAQLKTEKSIVIRYKNLVVTKIELLQKPIEPEFAYQKYLIQNFATMKYWGAGNSWGTQASLIEHPEYVKLVPLPDGTYNLESQVNNGGEQYYFNGDYMDNGNPVALTITKIGEPIGYLDEAETIPVYVYTIANGDNYYGYDGTSTVLGKNLAADSENALWTIISLDDAKRLLAFTEKGVVADATFLIEDHDFGRNNRYSNKWTMEASNQNLSGGNNTNNCAESYHSTFTLSQKLVDAPKGVYSLTAQGFYRQDGEDNDNLPYFYANDEKQTFPVKTGSENSMSDASASFSAGNYTISPIFVEVTEDGELTIGAQLEENTNLWCIWDNFVLTYYGTDVDLNELKNAAIIKEMNDLTEKATELNEEVEIEAVKAELQAAIDLTAEAKTTEQINAAIEALKAAIAKAETFAKAKAALANMKELVESTNVYTEEALNEYYGQWIAKYEAGELTAEEAVALQDPFLVTGWHASITCDNFLLSAWDTNPDFQDAAYYINTWSVEGESDGSEFKVPFFEYWTGDGDSLGEKTLTATMNNLEAGDYNVTAWVRVRIKNGAEAPAYGITMQANDGEAIDVTGEQVGTSQMYLKDVNVSGTVGEDGVLKIKFNVAADNNISWLSFKNVKFEKNGASGIETVNAVKKADGQYFDLMGRRVVKPAQGLYIVNGQKVLVK